MGVICGGRRQSFRAAGFQVAHGIQFRNGVHVYKARGNYIAPKCGLRKDFSVSVYLVTDRRTSGKGIGEIVEAAAKGDGNGNRATIIQLRDKDVALQSSIKLGSELRGVTNRYDATFIVNDSISLAKQIGADGVHLGQDDANVKDARNVLGNEAIVGVSAGTIEEALQAIRDGADYIGVGAVFATATKADAGDAIGPEGLADVVQAVEGRIPVVAIGGIGVDNAMKCRQAGADGVAVVSAIMQSEQPGLVAAQLHKIMNGTV